MGMGIEAKEEEGGGGYSVERIMRHGGVEQRTAVRKIPDTQDTKARDVYISYISIYHLCIYVCTFFFVLFSLFYMLGDASQ